MNQRTVYLITLVTLLFLVGTVSALTWQVETVDSGGYGEYTSIVLNAGGEPRVMLLRPGTREYQVCKEQL